MSDVDARIRAAFGELMSAAPEPPAFPDPVEPSATRPRHAPRRVGLAAVATFLVFVVGTVVVIGVARSRDHILQVKGAFATRWTSSVGPADGRGLPTVAWTGREYLVWGGEKGKSLSATGAAFDPATGRWTVLPEAPMAGRLGHASVWTGTEWIICCGAVGRGEAHGAAYDPARGTWRAIAPGPADDVSYVSAVWTGTEMVVVGGRSTESPAAYSPAKNAWTVLPPPPVALGADPSAIWTGDRVIAWPGVYGGGGDVPVAYTPATRQWSTLALPSGVLVPSRASLVWTGREVIAWGPSLTDPQESAGAAFSPATREWRSIATAPLPRLNDWDGAPGSQTAAWTGREMIVWTGGLTSATAHSTPVLAYDPATNRWRKLPSAPAPVTDHHPPLVFAGNEVIVYTTHVLELEASDPHSKQSSPMPTTVVVSSTSSRSSESDEGPRLDWSDPFGGGQGMVDAATAKASVSFSVDVPAAAGPVTGIWMTRTQAPHRALAFELSPVGGRVVLYRQISQTTQSALDALSATYAQRPGSGSTASTVQMLRGPKAFAVVGPQYVSLDWLEGNVRVTMIGEVTNYSLAKLLAEADTVYGSATAVAG